jgi:hypothetical protein
MRRSQFLVIKCILNFLYLLCFNKSNCQVLYKNFGFANQYKIYLIDSYSYVQFPMHYDYKRFYDIPIDCIDFGKYYLNIRMFT